MSAKWHIADVGTALMNVRFEGNNGHDADVTRCLLMTQKRTLRCFRNSQASHLVIIQIWKCRDPGSVRLTTGANDDPSIFFAEIGQSPGPLAPYAPTIKGLKWY